MPPNTSSAGPAGPKRCPRIGRSSTDRPSVSNPSASTASRSVVTFRGINVRAMAIKLRDLKTEARTLARAKQYAAALAAHDHMLAVNPLDNDSRRKIADLLLALGDRGSAAAVYRAVT